MSSAVHATSPIKCILPSAIPTAVPANWDAAVANVERHGAFTGGTPLGDTLGLEDIQGPRDGSHQADYMNLWGGRSPRDGRWYTGQVSLVSESWQHQPDGNIRIDQWIHQLSTDGSTRRSMHNYLVETTSGRVLDSGSIPFTDEEAAANAQRLITKFGALQPAPATQAFTDQRTESRVINALRRVQGCMTIRPYLVEPSTTGGFHLRAPAN